MKPNACWILCTPRTGSSLLCELLNNLGVFPPFDHPDMKANRGPLEIGQSFGEWMRLYMNPAQFCYHPPAYSKMIFHQYVEGMGSVSKSNRYNIGWYSDKHDKELMNDVSGRYNSDYVRKIFPDIKFIYLKRDILSHAVSLYFARMTKKYHIYDRKSLDDYIDTKIYYDQNRLLEAYTDALEYQISWESFLSGNENLLFVDYLNIVNDMKKTLSSIVEFLGCGGDVDGSIEKTHGDNKRIYKMTRPEAEEYREKLRKMTLVKLL